MFKGPSLLHLKMALLIITLMMTRRRLFNADWGPDPDMCSVFNLSPVTFRSAIRKLLGSISCVTLWILTVGRLYYSQFKILVVFLQV